MTIGTRLFTLFRGKPVGVDSFGNRYYTASRSFGPRAERRWVIYKGEADASAIPPEWHAWIHYTTDRVPSGTGPSRPWQKPHRPNPTGTALAYRPPGHALSGGQRAKATGDYEPWQPV
jgi:NADH:ubiquinone oxidoreductase subunit